MELIPIIKGLATFVPFIYKPETGKTGGTLSARYCYSVWLRHLVAAKASGLPTSPRVILEMGPGDSLGIGLAALLSGAKIYYALDVVRYANRRRDEAILDELIGLFKKKAGIPDSVEFPGLRPLLPKYDFPSDILTEELLAESLESNRLKSIREALLGGESGDIEVRYLVPWKTNDIRPESVDVVFSQAAMEHAGNLESAYRSMYAWLKPGGFMSHQIDFGSHGITRQWNGHLLYPDIVWKIVKGKRIYLLNRATYNEHKRIIERSGFTTELIRKGYEKSSIIKKDLARKFRNIEDEDLHVREVFIQAVKNKVC